MSKKERVPEESEPQYHFQGQSSGSQHWFYIDTDWVEDNFMTREPDYFKKYTLNLFEFKQIRIGFHFMFQLGVKILQFVFNSIQPPLS